MSYYRKKETYPPVKITFVGDSTVGKTSLVARFVQKTFSEKTQSTIGAAFVTMRYPDSDDGRLYHIWDTAGQERFGSLIPLYTSGAQVIVIVYDMTNYKSYERVKTHWLPFIRQNLRLGDYEKTPMIYLLGNKCDLADSERLVTTREANQFAEDHEMGFIEISAKTGENTAKVFGDIAEHADNLVIRQADSLRLSRSQLQPNTSCCSGPSKWFF